MAQLSQIERDMAKLKISDSVGRCDYGKSNCLTSFVAPPQCNFKSKDISSVEQELTVSNKKYRIKATGYYSDIYIGLMWGKTSDSKDRSHFGLILKQQTGWCINGIERKCLLIHHIGNGVEIANGCENCVRNSIKSVYPGLPHRKAKFYYYGRSQAALWRCFGEKSLGRNIGYQYNSAYTRGVQVYDWRTSNCLRLAFDMLFYIKLDYQVAVNFTINAIGHEKWGEVVKEISGKKENGDFFEAIMTMWRDMKQNDELTKIVKLINNQYRLDEAMEALLWDQVANFYIQEVLPRVQCVVM